MSAPVPHSLRWRTSSRSAGAQQCVEVAPTSSGVLVRHSKRHADGTIFFTEHSWAAFVDEACGDAAARNPTATIVVSPGGTTVRATGTGIVLQFTPAEWDAFVGGARDGEFSYRTMLGAL